MISRRDLITLVGRAAAAWPIAAQAQQPAIPVIGYLGAGRPAASVPLLAGFRKGLSEAGFTDGGNVAIEYRWAENQYDRLPALVADLVRRRADVIVTPGSTPAALAAKAATATIPIVFSVGGDPVRRGLVANLNRPGGNLTGFSELNADVLGKQLGLMHELVPGAKRFGALVNSTSPTALSFSRDAQTAATSIGRQIDILTASGSDEIDAAFARMAQIQIDALVVTADPLFYESRVQLAMLAMRHAVPGIYWDRPPVEAGGLLSYGSSVADQYRQVGVYAGRILRGEKTADLPVQQATKLDLVINLRTAKALGLEVPAPLLARADEVIE